MYRSVYKLYLCFKKKGLHTCRHNVIVYTYIFSKGVGYEYSYRDDRILYVPYVGHGKVERCILRVLCLRSPENASFAIVWRLGFQISRLYVLKGFLIRYIPIPYTELDNNDTVFIKILYVRAKKAIVHSHIERRRKKDYEAYIRK